MIVYGAPLLDRTPAPDLARHGLDADIEPGRYILYVSRLEPENQADLVIRAYRDVPGDVPLLIVGDAPYAERLQDRLAELAAADPRVRLTGAIYGDGYRDLQRAALAYIQATSVGGTHPRPWRRWAPATWSSPSGRRRTRRSRPGPGCCSPMKRSCRRSFAGSSSPPAQRGLPLFGPRPVSEWPTHYSWDAVTTQYEQLWERLRARKKIDPSDSRRDSPRNGRDIAGRSPPTRWRHEPARSADKRLRCTPLAQARGRL